MSILFKKQLRLCEICEPHRRLLWINATSGRHTRNPGQDVSKKNGMYGHRALDLTPF